MHRSALALVVALAMAAGACSNPPTPVVPDPDPFEYVALGDSYVAAPGVPETSGEDGCFRSTGNYAHLVAAAGEDVDLVDVSCSGATTADVLEKQVPSLSEKTDLVTIGIGGNDYDLFSGILTACMSGQPCGDDAVAQVLDLLPRIETNIGALFDDVVGAAPEAQVIVVGYPDLIPETGTCPDLLPLATADYPLVDEATLRLTQAVQRQAVERDLTYVDVHAASQGHDICADDPWINGAEMGGDGAVPFHPFAVEQAAVAAMVVTATDSAVFR